MSTKTFSSYSYISKLHSYFIYKIFSWLLFRLVEKILQLHSDCARLLRKAILSLYPQVPWQRNLTIQWSYWHCPFMIKDTVCWHDPYKLFLRFGSISPQESWTKWPSNFWNFSWCEVYIDQSSLLSKYSTSK